MQLLPLASLAPAILRRSHIILARSSASCKEANRRASLSEALQMQFRPGSKFCYCWVLALIIETPFERLRPTFSAHVVILSRIRRLVANVVEDWSPISALDQLHRFAAGYTGDSIKNRHTYDQTKSNSAPVPVRERFGTFVAMGAKSSWTTSLAAKVSKSNLVWAREGTSTSTKPTGKNSSEIRRSHSCQCRLVMRMQLLRTTP